MSLRGTRARINKWANAPRPATLQNQVSALRRQVNKNKAETLFHRSHDSITNNAGGGTKSVNLLPTQNLINDSGFRDDVTGDRWLNKYLKYKIYLEPHVVKCRLVAYIPKKSGNRFTPLSYTSFPDPSAFTVLRDKLVSIGHVDDILRSEARYAIVDTLKLRDRQTIYNSDSGVLERGELVVFIQTDSIDTVAGSKLYDYGYEVVYSNK